MAIELNLTSSNKEILGYLNDVKVYLIGIDDAYDKVEQSGKKAFGGAGKTTKEYNKEIKRTNGLIEDVEESIKKWEQKARKATNIKDIQRYNRKIAEGKKHLEQYRKTGVDAFDKVNKKTKESSDSVNKLTSRMTALISAAALYRITDQLLDSSLALDILDKKARTVFGDYVNDVRKVGKETASSLGMTEAEFLKATSNAGDVMKQLQLTTKEASVLSTGLITLSGSIAEWSAGEYDAIEVSKILTKAFLGEYETLKSLGIAIRDSDITAKLAEKGQKKLTGAAMSQAKALATLELLYERTGDRQQSFDENSGSLTRTYTELNAKLKTVRDNLSTDLIPTFNRMFGFVLKNFEAIKTFAKWVGIAGTAILGYKAGILITNGVMKAYTFVTNLATVATKTFDTATKTSLIGVFAALVASATAAFIIFRGEADDATDSMNDFNDEIERNKTLLSDTKTLKERADVLDKMTKEQLEKFKSDAQAQLTQISELEEDKLLAQKNYNDKLAALNALDANKTLYSKLKQHQDEVAAAKEHLDYLNRLVGTSNAEQLKSYIDTADARLKTLKTIDDSGDSYKKLKTEISDLEKQLRNEIAANNDNAQSTERLLRKKKELIEGYDLLYQSMTLVLDKLPSKDTNADLQLGFVFDDDAAKAEADKMVKRVVVTKGDLEEAAQGFNIYSDLFGMDPDDPDTQYFIQSFEESVSTLVGYLGQMLDAERAAADERLALSNTYIAEKQRELQAEISLNEQGYASNIALRQKELAALKRDRDKALKEQEKAKQKQLAMEAVLQGAALVTTSINLIKSAVKTFGIWGLAIAVPLVAAMFGFFIDSKSKAAQYTKLRKGRTGIIKGKSHEEGGEQFEVEGGEYHSITPKDKTKKHLPLLEAIRVDDKDGMRKALLNIVGDKLDHNASERIVNDANDYRTRTLQHAFSLDDEGVRENNRLLNSLLSKQDAPAVDNSDPDYTKLIYSDSYEKWVRK